MSATVLYINNEGGGYLEQKPIADGETIGSFLARNGIPPERAHNYNIRWQQANNPLAQRMEVTSDHVLQNGDRVSAVPRPGTVASSQQLSAGDRVSVAPKNIAGAINNE